MKPVNRECKSTIEQLVQYKELSAVNRSRVDMHLRRCDACRTAWEGLAHVEQLKFENEESFYIRNGPSSVKLPTSDTLEYSKKHFR